jgi:hypothetical protein
VVGVGWSRVVGVRSGGKIRVVNVIDVREQVLE